MLALQQHTTSGRQSSLFSVLFYVDMQVFVKRIVHIGEIMRSFGSIVFISTFSVTAAVSSLTFVFDVCDRPLSSSSVSPRCPCPVCPQLSFSGPSHSHNPVLLPGTSA